MTKRLPRLLSGLGLLSLTALSCFRPDPPRPKNVLFILVDTLRADHLGAYGYERPTSPGLDGFARSSVFFESARSQASCTFPSANSVLTSRYPQEFLGQPDGRMGIPEGMPSLAEILKEKGFATAAVTASPIVRETPTRFNPQGGFGRGFDRFVEECLWQGADCVNRKAREQLTALASGGRPFFLYLHYIDPHGPYAPPPAYRRRFAAGDFERAFVRNGDPNPIADHLYKGAPDPEVTPAELGHLVDLYDDEIGYFDSQLGGLLEELRRQGRLEDTMVVLTADHGEAFLEHGHVKHCRTLFDEEIRIPLAMSIPGVAARRVAAPAQNLDLVPTILDYLGFGTEGRKLEGTSLRARIEGPAAEAAAYQRAAMGTLRSVSDGRFKLVHDLATRRFQLYDLRADPGETRDTLAADRRDFHRLRLILSDWLAKTEGAALSESVRQAEEAERKLRSLGYLE
jgi:arylsulfatase A-like enzyme